MCVFVNVWVFGAAAAAVLMAMICKSECMAAAVVEVSCWSRSLSSAGVSLCSVCVCTCGRQIVSLWTEGIMGDDLQLNS